MNASRNITDLPLEVLSLILKELPSLEDRLCLAQVHPHIGLAFSWQYAENFKNIDLAIKNYLSVLLPLCGSSVEHIKGVDMLDGAMWNLLKLHCPNLQSIKILISSDNINSIKSFLEKVRSLRSLTLYVRCGLQNHSGIVELLKFQPSLRRLQLQLFPSEVLEVQNLVNLEELIIYRCWDFIFNIHELCHRLKNLQKLEFISNVLTAPLEFDEVPCPALRELHLSVLRNREYPRTRAILEWILSHAERLEILTLNIQIPNYEPEIVIYRILSECKNLRSLSMFVDEAHTEFAYRVVKLVSENGVTSEERPLDLNFRNSGLHRAIQKVMTDTSAKQLITFKNFVGKN